MSVIPVAATVLALAAGPTVLATNTHPKPREIGAVYFDTMHQSQVWMNVAPALPEPDPAPVLLNITIAFPGLRLEQAPATVRVRAASICRAFPLRIRQPVLQFFARGMTVDLTAEGAAFQFVASCSPKGPLDTIVADLPFATLQRIAQDSDVRVDALGFSLRLSPAGLAAWRLFVRTVEHGVIVSPR